MELLSLSYTKVILQLFQDKLKVMLIQWKRFHLKKIKPLINQTLKDLLIFIKKNWDKI